MSLEGQKTILKNLEKEQLERKEQKNEKKYWRKRI